jgi:hypothetical protein
MRTSITTVKRWVVLTLVAGMAAPGLASAQIIKYPVPGGPIRRGPIVLNLPGPTCSPVPTTYVRNLPYSNYSSYASKSTSAVPAGGSFAITVNCMPWSGQIKVVLQDVNAPSQVAAGFTGVFQLTAVQRSGNTLTVQTPNQAYFKGKTYYVSVFVLGNQPGNYAQAPGTLTIQ